VGESAGERESGREGEGEGREGEEEGEGREGEGTGERERGRGECLGNELEGQKLFLRDDADLAVGAGVGGAHERIPRLLHIITQHPFALVQAPPHNLRGTSHLQTPSLQSCGRSIPLSSATFRMVSSSSDF